MRYEDRHPLNKGYYWELATGRILYVPGPQMGDRRKHYVRIHPFFIVPLGPLFGLLYVIWLPLVAIIFVGSLIVGKVRRGVRAGGGAISPEVGAGQEHRER